MRVETVAAAPSLPDPVSVTSTSAYGLDDLKSVIDAEVL